MKFFVEKLFMYGKCVERKKDVEIRCGSLRIYWIFKIVFDGVVRNNVGDWYMIYCFESLGKGNRWNIMIIIVWLI